jgi:hypothetical protein
LSELEVDGTTPESYPVVNSFIRGVEHLSFTARELVTLVGGLLFSRNSFLFLAGADQSIKKSRMNGLSLASFSKLQHICRDTVQYSPAS